MWSTAGRLQATSLSGKTRVIWAFPGDGSLEDIARDGRLLALVEDICTHLLILDRGRRVFFGPINEARTAFASGTAASLEEVFFRAIQPQG